MTYSSKTPCPDRVLPSTLHISHCTLHSSHSKLQTSHSTLHTPHFSLLTASFTLQTSHFTLHTALFALHTSRPTRPTALNLLQPWRSHYYAICKDWVAKHNRTTRNWVGNCRSKTGSRRQSEKKTILKHFLKGFLEGKSLAPKWRKSADKSLSQPSCSHSNTIYEVQLQKTIVLRMQPWQEATLTQPLLCDLQRLSCKTQ